MPIDAGDIVYSIGGDDKALDKSLGKSEGKIKAALGRASTIAIGFGAAITGALAVAVTQWADAGDQIQKLALKTGFSTEALSELKHAAELSGTTIESLETASKKLARTIFEASEGTETYTDALAGIGLTYEELEGLSPEEQFLKTALALADVSDQTTRAALAQELFGRAGTELLPMLAQGREGLEAMRAEAHELGIVFDQAGADKAAEFNDNLDRLKKSFKGLMFQIAPVIADLSENYIPAITDAIKGGVEWLKNNEGLIKTIIPLVAKVGALSLGLGLAIKIGTPFVLLIKSMSKASAITAGAKGIGGLTSAMGTAGGGGGGLIASLAGPVGVVALLGVAAVSLYKLGDAIVKTIKNTRELKKNEEGLSVTVSRQIGILDSQGAAFDKSTLAGKSNGEQIQILDKAIKKHVKTRDAGNKEIVKSAQMSSDAMQDINQVSLEKQGSFANQMFGFNLRAWDLSSRSSLSVLERAEKSQTIMLGNLGTVVKQAFNILDPLSDTLRAMWDSLAGLVGRIGGLGGGGGGLGGRALGGPVAAGQPFLVGERGPEIFVPRGAGNIVPTEGAGAAGGVNVNVTIPGMVIERDVDIDTFSRRFAQTIRRELRTLGVTA